jgi:2-keto-3-deoxy-L-rhamnonate aldolase RhmA
MQAGFMKNLKERVRKNQTLFGCFLGLGSPLTAEIMGRAGYDWALIDLEHGAGDERDTLFQLQALEHTAAAAIVRVESNARQRVHRVLDLGAHGIMFPRIDNAGQARDAVAAMRYPPLGVRGVASANRACEFGSNFLPYLQTANDTLLCVVQIETQASVKNVEEIAAVDGVDVLFIGPADLSQGLGILGEFRHPTFVDAIERTARAAAKFGKTSGILLPKPEDFAFFHEFGYRFLGSGADGILLNNAARSLVKTLHASLERGQAPAG